MFEYDTKPVLYKLGTKIYRFIQILVTCVLCFALVYGWQWLSDPSEFPIRSVKIQSTYNHINQETIQAKVLPYVDEGFIRLSTRVLKEDLLKLPWIADVKIERIWPDVLVVKISEQQAAAKLGADSLLNEKGEVFTPSAETLPEDLPILNSPPDQIASLWTTYQAMREILKPLGLYIHKLDMDDRLSLKITLTTGTIILLGKTDPLLRLERFVKVYPTIFPSDTAQAEYIDLRYENGAAVNWRTINPKPDASAASSAAAVSKE